MAFTVKIYNNDENRFSLNDQKLLSKNSYEHFVEGELVGLRNKFTKKLLLDLTHYKAWSSRQTDSFETVESLINYLVTYIEGLKKDPNIFTQDIQQSILDELRLLNNNFAQYFAQNQQL